MSAVMGRSNLLLARHGSAEAFHVLFAVDVAGDNVRVITSYRPDHKFVHSAESTWRLWPRG